MTTALGLGAVLGLGLWALAVGLFPPRPPLGVLLRRVTTPPAPPAPGSADPGWATRLGRPLVPALAALGLPTPRLRRDLALLGHPTAAHLARQATGGLAGLLTPAAAQGLLGLGGLAPGPAVPLGAAVVLGAAGFLAPDWRVRAAATRRRADFRHALSAYLDLVSITLAGGAGVDSALTHAAALGQGWAFTRIHHALDTARLTRTTPGTALRRLGNDLDIGELTELAASISLAGTEGARIRASLAAKADALRTRRLTDAEADAHAATEQMTLPVTLLFCGFLVFLGYPALIRVLTAL